MSDFEEENILVDAAKFKNRIKVAANRNLFKVITRSFFGLFIFVLIFAYLLTPLGKIKINKLTGNKFLNTDDILNIADISDKDLLLSVKEDEVIKKLNDSSYIATSKVSWHLTYLNIYVDEIAPIAKDENKVLLTNGLYLTDYQFVHQDYEIKEGLTLPSYLNYLSSNDSELFLNSLKLLSEEMYDKVMYLDERMVISSEENGKFFGVYFKINEDLFRIQFAKDILSEALDNHDVLQVALNDYQSFDKVHVEELDTDVYEALYSCNKNACSIKKITERR